MNAIPRIALVGVTGYGRVHFGHLRDLAEAGECDFAAAAVVNPESSEADEPLSWLRSRGAAIYPTANALFAAESGRLDLVCLPVGIAAHEPLVKAALAVGANVLVEKPAAGCVAAVDRMIAAEQAASPHRVFVGFQHVSAPEVREIRRIIASGTLGAPLRVVCTGIWPRGDAYYARNNWAARLAVPDGTPVRDSPANNAFAHYLNLALCFASRDPAMPAEPVTAEGALYRARPEIETFDTCMVRFRTADGVPVLLCLSHASDKVSNPRIRVECERGTVLWTHEGPWEVRGESGEAMASGVAEPPHKAMFRAVCEQSFCHKEHKVFVNSVPFVAKKYPASLRLCVENNVPVLCTLPMARPQVSAIELLTETLPVTPLVHSAVRREDGQWLVPSLPEAFDGVWQTGELELPRWS